LALRGRCDRGWRARRRFQITSECRCQRAKKDGLPAHPPSAGLCGVEPGAAGSGWASLPFPATTVRSTLSRHSRLYRDPRTRTRHGSLNVLSGLPGQRPPREEGRRQFLGKCQGIKRAGWMHRHLWAPRRIPILAAHHCHLVRRVTYGPALTGLFLDGIDPSDVSLLPRGQTGTSVSRKPWRGRRQGPSLAVPNHDCRTGRVFHLAFWDP